MVNYSSIIENKLELIFKKSKIFLSIVETLDIIELSITLFLKRSEIIFND